MFIVPLVGPAPFTKRCRSVIAVNARVSQRCFVAGQPFDLDNVESFYGLPLVIGGRTCGGRHYAS